MIFALETLLTTIFLGFSSLSYRLNLCIREFLILRSILESNLYDELFTDVKFTIISESAKTVWMFPLPSF